ncbi:glucosamine-6-phosphate deaminase [Xanthovirga aplysinae]|uniref:glucosamine-6-phosphate deaminase n=1 Tax=Xanthovirga aplysinae TaxID=2529853 RepID=UPI0012BB7E6A|nr:glucosamine-6-phosphate deaminase [Xanthovirga aplysinae]MTI30164.1 glucosamine-6-phosphate deaminase [Xanthovirga aplysinae]
MSDIIVDPRKTNYDIRHQKVGTKELTRFERIHTEIFIGSREGSAAVAEEIAELIQSKERQGQQCILGLATGSSPIHVYAELVRMHKEEGLSFRNVVTFNLDEYYPMDPKGAQSYVRFMDEHLFSHVDILKENIHIPDGMLSPQEVQKFCVDYELKIKALGGLDLQILGIGRTGHIGFNEPGSHRNSITRPITLDHITISDAAKDFNGVDAVPRKAITMGVSTILKARRVILMAWGTHKADIVRQMLEGEITSSVPATYLQLHANATVVVDEAAAFHLKRQKTPWLVGPCIWTEDLKKKAIVWLCQKVNKPILKLTNRDYNSHGMSGLLAEEGSSYELNIRMFNRMQHTITGWPGGKPGADDTFRPERAEPAKKRVLVFSPHPDDDVISMGGTLLRLVEQGHEVHVAYQTSGNIAVADHDALRFAEVAADLLSFGNSKNTRHQLFLVQVIDQLKNKGESNENLSGSLKIKSLIRRGEAKAAARFCGVLDEQIHFLDLPFYETGKVKKKPIGEEDLQRVYNLIEKVKPHQIYAAGDLADPHGTHKVCLDIIMSALARLRNKTFMKECYVWLYRGAWHEWPINEIDMAVPLSPDELRKKRKAIFFHQSQKDEVMFQGSDEREFWQRAEERNRETASLYDGLGLPEYEAFEAFKRYYF